jgi:GcrA cell cycle regulator
MSAPPVGAQREDVPMTTANSWSDERVEALKAAFRAGHSFSVIARTLGGGVSRSACIGKATRLGLERTRDHGEFHRIASKVATANRAQTREAARLRAPPVARATAQNNGLNFGGPRMRPAGLKALAAFEEPGEGSVRMIDVERRHCRWPFGDPETSAFRFCGAPKAKGAYCAAHAERAYAPPFEGESPDLLVRLYGRLA